MKRHLLWAFLGWLGLLSFGARAQTNVLLAQENFEAGTAATNPTYGYTANNFQVTTNTQYFQRQLLSPTAPAYPGTSQQVTNIEGSYAWTAEGVRGTGTQTVRSAGYVLLNPVTASGYRNFRMEVAFADPAGTSCGTCSRNAVLASDRVRLQYSFDGGPFVTAGLLANSSGGYWQQDTSTPLDSVADGTIINQDFKNIVANISGTGSSLRVRVVCDFRSPILVFDNIRVYGDVNTVATPTLNGLETTAASYTEGGGPVPLTSALTAGYSDNSATTFAGGTVSVSANFVSGDQLNFTNQNGITGSYNTGNGILTLSGTASQAAYQAALRSISYSSTNTTTLNTGTRQITFLVRNGTAVSNSPVRTLNITGVLNAPAALNYTEDFNADGDGTRYFGNAWTEVNARVGSFRATNSPASSNGTQIGEGVFTGWSGGYWFGEGTPNTANPTNPYGLVQLAPVNAVGRSNIRFTVAIGSAGNWLGYFNANNPGDQFELFYSTDGGATLTQFGAFYGVDGTTPARQDADLNILTPAAGTQLSPALQDFTFTLPAAAAVSNLTFVLRQRSRGQAEIAYDNIRITGTSLPTVTTITPATDIQTTSVTLGGTVTADGGGTLTERGIVYVAGTGTPTTSNTKAVVATSGIVVGTPFSGTVTALTAGTQYTARAYAINEAGTSYGANLTFTTATTITSIALVDPSPANTGQVRFTVTFADAVTGLSSTNFSITTDGTIAGASIASIIGSGKTYTVTVNTGTGSGTQLQLNLANSTGLSPSVSNVPFKDASYSIDKTAPATTISSTAGISGSTTGTTPVPFTITFSEAVTGFVQGNLTVTGGTVSGFSGSGTTYTVDVTPSGSNNTVTVNVAANTAQDAANNGNTAASPFSITFQAPTITVAPASLPNGTQGTAYSQILSASGGTAPYAYAITAGALPAGMSLSTGGTLSGTPTANGTFNFTVTATDNSTTPGPYSGARSYSLTIAAPAVTAVTWTGTVSTDWFNANNWTPNQVPDATLNVTIPTSPSGGRFPAITPGTASTRNLTINLGATLTQISGTLVIAANLTNNGTFQPTGGTVVLGTTALSSILGSSNIRFWNLTVGTSGAQQSTSASTSVQRLLLLNGNFVTNGNPFTLESNATNTAMVINNGNAVVSGTVTVQRYIDPSNPGLGYRHYSSPVQTTTIADLTTSSFTPVVNGNYTSATAPRQVQPYPTVYYYDQSRLASANASYAVGDFDNGFLSPSALSSPLVPGRGYAVNVSSATLVDFVGQLNNGTVATGTLARGAQANTGWQLLGNPYPSPIDWNQLLVNSVGIENGLYIFKSSGQYTGAYAAYVNGQGVNGGTGTIPSMQGFFVRVAPGQTGSVTFTNSCRLTTYNNPAFARQAADTRPTIRLELLTVQGEKEEALVYFEQGATSGVDTRYDALKLGNATRLNLCSRVGSDFLAINGLPNLSAVPLTVPLSVQVPSTGRYTLLASQLANLAGNRVVLHDRQTGTRTDLTDPAGYVVELTEGQHGDRFDLLFNPATELTPRKKGQSIPAKRH